jgi:glycine betaine/choline ABC-type transport system substrate-binding protein
VTRSLRLILSALAALALALGAIACGSDDEEEGGGGGGGGGASSGNLIESDPANAKTSITVGSKNFDEQYILGEIYAQALDAAGFKIDKKLNLGSEQIAYKALQSGQVDAYPEYTGTSLTSFFDVKTADVPKDPDAAYELAKKEYAAEDITALPRTSFENTYRIATTKEKQADILEGAKTLSEVAELPNASKISLAGFPECRQRTDCLLGLKALYNWTPKFVADEGKYDPIDKDRADLGFVFSTDGELTLGKYAIIEDDKNLFPPYNISFGIRNDTLEKMGDAGRQVIIDVQEPLTEQAMQELNSRVSLDKEEPQAVAKAYLQEEGFIE